METTELWYVQSRSLLASELVYRKVVVSDPESEHMLFDHAWGSESGPNGGWQM